MDLIFGTAGIPISTVPHNTIDGIKKVNSLGLGAMELEFVRSVNISQKKAPEVNKTRKEHGVSLTCHAPYYINLNSNEPEKIKASISRILNSARIAWLCGAKSVTFHAGFYMKQDPEKVYQTIKSGLEHITETLQKEDNKILIRPELTGKPTQFGSLEELIRLSKDIGQVQPCIDFSHYYARSIGKNNTKESFSKVIESMKSGLGKSSIKNMHIHVSGIAHGPKGEKNHLILKESQFNYKDLLKVFKEYKVGGVVICESPNIEQDALLMKDYYNSL